MLLRKLMVLLFFPVLCHASCGTASCPIDTLTRDTREKGWVRLGYDFEYIPQDQPRIGTHPARVGEQPGHHDEVYMLSRVHRFTASIGLTDRWSADFLLPYISRSHEHIHHHRGEELNETWDFGDVGDFVGQVRYSFLRPETPTQPTVSLLLGGKFPTGTHHKTNDDGDLAEIAMQPGSGSYDLIVGLTSLQVFSMPMFGGLYGTMPFFASTSYQRNGRGVEGYKIGNTFLANLGVSYPVMKPLGLLLQLNGRVRERDDRGETTEEIGKTGGEFLYITPGMEWRLSEAWLASALIQLPVYQHVNQLQLTSDYNVITSVSYRFKL